MLITGCKVTFIISNMQTNVSKKNRGVGVLVGRCSVYMLGRFFVGRFFGGVAVGVLCVVIVGQFYYVCVFECE